MTQHSGVVDDICSVSSTRVKKELGGTIHHPRQSNSNYHQFDHLAS